MNLSKNIFIVGAGFSHNAGLPLAMEFTDALLNPKTPLKSGEANAILIDAVKSFVNTTFGDEKSVSPEEWPQLEDIFTTIDLAANSGHHLGAKYSASILRTIRRALIARYMRMLRIAYNEKKRSPDEAYERLKRLISLIDTNDSAFLSLNWDTVIESEFASGQRIKKFDYGCDALSAEFSQNGTINYRTINTTTKELRILKPHGSINWMYCDCCGLMLWFQPKETLKIAARLFKKSDGDIVHELIGQQIRIVTHKALCPRCKAEALGTRFATFSYRKALEFPMHLATWREAERQLRHAENWIFIGYSLPAADYEFKFLLKRVQLSRTIPPNIVVVTKGTPTAENYRRFFGKKSVQQRNILEDGFNDEVLERLGDLGVLGS